MKKTVKLIIIAIVSIVVIMFSLPLILAGLGTIWTGLAYVSTPDPPKPEITYAEFPFRIEIECEGKRIILEDTVVCEFDGIKMKDVMVGGGKYRTWKRELKNGSESPVPPMIGSAPNNHLFTLREKRENDEVLEAVKYFLGSAEWYMGEPNSDANRVKFRVYWKHGLDFETEEDVLKQYGIKIISIEETPPIKNTFK
jgi:hypothetical protein